MFLFPLDGTVAVLVTVVLFFSAATYPNITCNFPYGWFIFCRQKDIFVSGMWRNAVVWHQMGAEQRDVISAPARLFWGSLVWGSSWFSTCSVWSCCHGNGSESFKPTHLQSAFNFALAENWGCGAYSGWFITVTLHESAAPPSWLKKTCNVCFCSFPGCSGLL